MYEWKPKLLCQTAGLVNMPVQLYPAGCTKDESKELNPFQWDNMALAAMTFISLAVSQTSAYSTLQDHLHGG